LFKRDQAQPLLTRINLQVSRWIKKIMKVAFFILGLLLLADFVGYLLGHPLLVPQ
jgi:hypothetical protein